MSDTEGPVIEVRPTTVGQYEAALQGGILETGGSLAPRRLGAVWRVWADRALQSQAEAEEDVAELASFGLERHSDRPRNRWDRTDLDYTFMDIVLEAPQRSGRERLPGRHRGGLPGDHR